MESEWRYNIAFYGLVGYGLRLLARRRDLPNYLLGKDEASHTGRLSLFYVYDPDQLPLYLGPVGDWYKPFPNGYDVWPDS